MEAVEFETAASLRRRVSVDFILDPALFGDATFSWGGRPIHYVPIAVLNKQPLTRFDVRDEDGSALPVMSRNKNAKITAGALTALAQSVLAAQLRLHDQQRFGHIRSPEIAVPADLEYDFWRLAHLDFTRRGDTEDAEVVYRALATAVVDAPISISQWPWSQTDSGAWSAAVDPQLWRWALASDADFLRLASDCSRVFPVAVPIEYEEGARRLIKFSYTQHLRYPEAKLARRFKAWTAPRLARRWNQAEDWFEGMPQHQMTRDRSIPEQHEAASALSDGDGVSLRTKAFRWLGWGATPLPLWAPAIGHARSYHLDVTVPAGIQIRRAQLVVKRAGQDDDPLPARWGYRSVRHAHLYASGAGQSATAQATIHFRPEAALLQRAATIAGGLTALALTLLYIYASHIDDAGAQTAGAILVVVPGLLGLYAARGEEHPLATRLAFGARVVASAPAGLAAAGAGLLVVSQVRTPAGMGLFIAAWVVTVILLIGWRLAARGRPHPEALWEE
ncbi:MAG: hypothetical protein ACJ76Z_02890 [Thermoleophilaceae bacterium]